MTISASDNTNQGGSTDVLVDDPGNATWITASLSWTDENPPRLLQNEPDTFTVTILDQEGNEIASETSSSGTIQARANVTQPMVEDEDDEIPVELGQFTVIVTCDDAGDIFGPLGIVQRQTDPGNDWELSVTVDYLEEKMVET